ncbi:MAG: DUF2752 domain-containing protein [Bacteroidales bacterium]|nr:DUF2752 domain-containing protein [Bacteroidales bacterium]
MKSFRANLKSEPYLIFNLVFAGILIIVFIYSGIFSPEKDKYPVQCIHEKITGEECVSCGMSHSFSLILRGRIQEAVEWNRYSPAVFLFFAIQLLMRFIFSFLWLRFNNARRVLIPLDITLSAIMFVIAFLPFMKYIFTNWKTLL